MSEAIPAASCNLISPRIKCLPLVELRLLISTSKSPGQICPLGEQGGDQVAKCKYTIYIYICCTKVYRSHKLAPTHVTHKCRDSSDEDSWRQGKATLGQLPSKSKAGPDPPTQMRKQGQQQQRSVDLLLGPLAKICKNNPKYAKILSRSHFETGRVQSRLTAPK